VTAETTAAELIGLLRDETYTDWKLEADAADLIEQQAGLLVAAAAERDEWKHYADKAVNWWLNEDGTRKAVEANEKLAREGLDYWRFKAIAAEAKIARARHEKHCASLRLEPGIPEHAWGCNCWKSASPVSALDAVRADAWDEGYDVTLSAARSSGREVNPGYDIDVPKNPYRTAQTEADQ
jgi:hypothetical protein